MSTQWPDSRHVSVHITLGPADVPLAGRLTHKHAHDNRRSRYGMLEGNVFVPHSELLALLLLIVTSLTLATTAVGPKQIVCCAKTSVHFNGA